MGRLASWLWVVALLSPLATGEHSLWRSSLHEVATRDHHWTIEETRPPEGVFAGKAFNSQPFITIYDSDTGAIGVKFVGDVYAVLETGPTGFEALRYNGTMVQGAAAHEDAVRVYGGSAEFKELSLNELGGGYRIRYVARERRPSGEMVEVCEVVGAAFHTTLNVP